MSGRDRAIGIAAGIVLGIAVVVVFVFAGGDDAVDAPSVEGGAPPAKTAGEPGAGKRDGAAKSDAAGEEEPSIPEIVVKEGEPQGGVAELPFHSGEEVRFRVVSDVPAQVHVHGYEIYKDVVPGEPARIGFPAEFEGAYEVELHLHETGGEVQIAELEVTPG